MGKIQRVWLNQILEGLGMIAAREGTCDIGVCV